jgi:hypothetical protein
MSTIDPAERDDSTLSSWLTDQIERTFMYIPAQYNGEPVSREMSLLIRFYPDEGSDPMRGLSMDWAKSGITVVDLVSAVPGKGYELIYAGHPLFEEVFSSAKSQ